MSEWIRMLKILRDIEPLVSIHDMIFCEEGSRVIGFGARHASES